MKFNPEEIKRCKQIAGKHRKEIKYGDWYWSQSHNKPLMAIAGGFKANDQKHFGVFKIWTISDCLEFLRGEGYLVRLVEYEHYGGVKTITCYCHGHKTKGAFSKQGNKDEETCLKAVLAVLEEGK